MDFNKLKGHVPDKVLAELPTIARFKIDTPIEKKPKKTSKKK